MEFGYFTLSDNDYDNNPRDANQFVADITAEGDLRRPAWHAFGLDRRAPLQFARRAVLARAGAELTSPRTPSTSASRRRSTSRRCIIRSASPSNGRRSTCCPAGASISPPGAATTAASTSRSTSRSPTTSRSSRKAWRWCRSCGRRTAASTHHGKHYQFDDVRITPKPVQQPLPIYIGSFSKPSIELAARLGCGLIVAPFAAAMSYGGLKQVADLYHETCAKHGNTPQRLMCSYFTHFYDTAEQEQAAARAPDPLLQRVRDPRLPERSQDRAAELSVLHRHGRAAAQGQAART